MNRLLPIASTAAWAGGALLLSRLRWIARPPVRSRIADFVIPRDGTIARDGRSSVEAVRELFGRPARELGERIAAVLGVTEPLAVRLERVHAPADQTGFRLRQLGVSAGVLPGTATAAGGLGIPTSLALAAIGVAPVVTFLAFEHRTVARSERWQQRLRLEMPVVAEQLAMLVGAGWSVPAALNRVAARGTGAIATDLERVGRRLRHGLSESEALHEWAELARVDAIDRLVRALDRHHDASDLGRVIAGEARAVRGDLHRQQIEDIERRGQQVWIPVTVAALVPGAMFLAIPFVDALRLFGAV